MKASWPALIYVFPSPRTYPTSSIYLYSRKKSPLAKCLTPNGTYTPKIWGML